MASSSIIHIPASGVGLSYEIKQSSGGSIVFNFILKTTGLYNIWTVDVIHTQLYRSGETQLLEVYSVLPPNWRWG